ncbi:hypothetical protein EGR_10367 [Echinococcus granulosus]|uniref:Uncharacterized protein n=1 Tax=Echinococcus granulosus TaxID=6210 RepID=W6U153_ECHGR|nr:hypothetical protein EGR_10367 [Echinococcus granulosus]EUB54768.1 hypothetical protein EGR_10367 [Echinococcus granulosus]
MVILHPKSANLAHKLRSLRSTRKWVFLSTSPLGLIYFFGFRVKLRSVQNYDAPTKRFKNRHKMEGGDPYMSKRTKGGRRLQITPQKSKPLEVDNHSERSLRDSRSQASTDQEQASMQSFKSPIQVQFGNMEMNLIVSAQSTNTLLFRLLLMCAFKQVNKCERNIACLLKAYAHISLSLCKSSPPQNTSSIGALLPLSTMQQPLLDQWSFFNTREHQNFNVTFAALRLGEAKTSSLFATDGKFQKNCSPYYKPISFLEKHATINNRLAELTGSIWQVSSISSLQANQSPHLNTKDDAIDPRKIKPSISDAQSIHYKLINDTCHIFVTVSLEVAHEHICQLMSYNGQNYCDSLRTKWKTTPKNALLSPKRRMLKHGELNTTHNTISSKETFLGYFEAKKSCRFWSF